MTADRVDAIIVSYNSAGPLRRLLTDRTFTNSFRRVIVVDNDSSDDSAKVAVDLGADVVRADGNRGFAAGVNLGLRKSDAEFTAVLNPDVRLSDVTVVPRLLAHFADPRVALVAPALELPDGSIQDSARRVPTPLDLLMRRRVSPRRGAVRPVGVVDVPWVVAAFIVLRREFVLEIGGLDERFFLYFEDVDLCVRLHQHGRRVLLDATARVHHEHQKESSDSLLSVALRRHMRSAAKFYRKHPRYLAGATPGFTGRSVVMLAWGAHTSRAQELAAAFGGQAYSLNNPGLSGPWTAPLRWAINAGRTIGVLARTRPAVVFAQNPPVFLGLLAWGYSRLTGAKLILDSHPTSFGRKGSRRWQRLIALHAFVAKRASAVLVTEEELHHVVSQWGGTPVILHEPPRTPRTHSGPNVLSDHDPGDLVVLLVAVFAPDEPVEEAVGAAAATPEMHLYVTGDETRAPTGLIAGAPDNVSFLGYLRGANYDNALLEADVVLALSTEPTSVMRAAYEAVYAGRPAIISDWPVNRSTFPYAMYAVNTADGLQDALAHTRARLASLQEAAAAAREAQLRRWGQQVDAVLMAIGEHGDDSPQAGATS